MRLRDLLNLPPAELKQWGVIIPQAVADAVHAAQTGQMRVQAVPLVDGRAVICADVLAHEAEWFAALAQIERDDCQCMMWPACVGMMDRYDGEEAPEPPAWVQILGAGLGPFGAVDGWPVGARTMHNGAVRVSRVPFNVNEPMDDAETTWSRLDGQYVVPAGWQYQIGEELIEGGEWFRVTQATSFRPSESPAQFVHIDGPGGEPVATVAAWVQPSGGHDAYAAGAVVTHNGQTWLNTYGNGNGWEPGIYGWTAQ